MKKICYRTCLLIMCALLCFGACAHADSTIDTSAEIDERPEVAGNVVATLGEIVVTNEDATGLYEYLLEMYEYLGYDIEDPELISDVKDTAIEGIVMQEVNHLMEHEYGLDVFTDEDEAVFAANAQTLYDNAYADIYAYIDDGKTDPDDLADMTDALMIEYGYEMDEIIAMYRDNEAYNRLYAFLTKDVTASDEDIAHYYEDEVAYDASIYADDPAGYVMQSMYAERPVYAPEGIRTVKHILIKYADEDVQAINELLALDEKPDDYDQRYEALKQSAYEKIKPTVDEIMEKIAAGEDFDALVAEYGEDPGMKSEPYINEGYMMYEGAAHLVAEFVEAGMALKNIGDVTPEPALTSYGAHIMMYYSDIAAGAAEMDEAKADYIREILESDQKQEAFDTAVSDYKAALGTIYKYPENMIGSAGTGPENELADDTLVIDGTLIDGDVEIVEVDE